MKLYSYFRSSTSYRVRIALNLKGLKYEQVPVNLKDDDHLEEDYKNIHPQNQVPVLEVDGKRFTQSLAIIDYLEETYPEPALLPETPEERAHVRSLAHMIALDIHPIDNLRVLKYLKQNHGFTEEETGIWYRHWIRETFDVYESLIEGKFSSGDTPTLADICLVPQVYNALRFDLNMSSYPLIMKVYETCLGLSAFDRAQPENQEDCNL